MNVGFIDPIIDRCLRLDVVEWGRGGEQETFARLLQSPPLPLRFSSLSNLPCPDIKSHIYVAFGFSPVSVAFGGNPHGFQSGQPQHQRHLTGCAVHAMEA